MKKYLIIVPSWSELSAEMQVETGCKYPAFVRLGGIPLYAHILKQYESIKEVAEFVFVLDHTAPNLLSNYVTGFDVSVSKIKVSCSIADTVLSALENKKAGQSLVVHMADTLLTPLSLNQNDAIYVQSRSDLYRWTSIIQNETGAMCILHDRDHRTAGVEQSVCVGVFLFSDGDWFAELLRRSIESNSETREPFFVAIEAYSKKYKIDLVQPDFWYDCGHVDSFYESRLNFHNLRHFNSLTYDSVLGRVTKRSRNVEAFRHQVRWFKQVPDELASFLPQIFDSNDGATPYITMELLSIPTISELFVDCRLELGAWNDVANRIKYICNLLHTNTFESPIAAEIAHSIYVVKTRKRIQEFIMHYPEAVNMWVSLNSLRISLLTVLETLEDYAARNGLLSLSTLTPIHGDMCFSNLLYDPRGRNVKLIDPRGEFGVPGIYGDSRYDIAKLMHSYSGCYDFIVSDRFNIEVDPSGLLGCEVEINEYHTKVKQIFNLTFFEDDQVRREFDAIQGLLFLSMLPLHSDKPNRQLAMLFTGLYLYGKNLLEGECL